MFVLDVVQALKHRVDSRDVLDPNAQTKTAFAGRIVGRFKRAGPNVWDDYTYERFDGEVVHVPAAIKVQVETDNLRVRMRRRGLVVVVEWIPSSDEQREIENHDLDPRDYFLSRCVSDYSSPPGLGLAAVVVKKLREE